MSKNPFPGPLPYRIADRARFFARDAAVKKLTNHVLAYPTTMLYGPSGAGKSSLMQAGVIPVLKECDRMRVIRIDAWPTNEKPLRWLVAQMFTDLDLGDTPDEKKPIQLKNAMALAFRRSERAILIYLDQIEQLFIAEHGDMDMNALLRGLSWLIRPSLHQDVHIVLSLREDYVGRLRDWTRRCPELSAHGFRVTPLSVAEMAKAMCRTAKQSAGSQAWSEQEIQQLMLDVRVPGQRPTDQAEVQTAFGQIVCRALWDDRAAGLMPNGQATNAETILRRYLDITLKGLGGLQDLAQQLLEEHLIDHKGQRKLLTEKEAKLVLGDRAYEVIEPLERAAILRAQEHQGSRYFELGHDWLAKKLFERRLLRLQAAGREAVAHRLTTERHTRRRSTTTAVFGAACAMLFSNAAIVLLALGARKFDFHNLEGRNVDDALLEKNRILDEQSPRLIPNCSKEYQNERPVLVDDSRSRWQAIAIELMARNIPRNVLRHDDWVQSASFGPDGTQIVTGSYDNTARVWNAAALTKPLTLRGHGSAVLSVAWSPDGKRIATASMDNTARIWNADGSGGAIVLKGHEGTVWSAAWSPDGTRIVTASSDKTARVWNVNDPQHSVVLAGHAQSIYSAAWNFDGTRILTRSSESIRIWNANGVGDPIALISTSSSFTFTSAAWSPDGTRILLTSWDPIAQIRRADGQGAIVNLQGHALAVACAAWSPDGNRIVTGSWDQTARLWNADGSPGKTLAGHSGVIRAVAWSPDGTRILTGSDDNTARIWDANGSGEPIILREHDDDVWFVGWSPDGKQAITASKDGTARIWLVDMPLLTEALGNEPSVCLTPSQREIYLRENASVAQLRYEECARSHGSAVPP